LNKPPAFQFYAKDWLSSSNVRIMSWSAKGVFIELLALCWDNEGLPLDQKVLRRMAGVAPQTWKIVWPQVRPQFSEINGRFWNPKILKIWLDLQRISELRSQAARQTQREGFIYAALKPSARLVKIGITNNLKQRMGALRQDIPPGELPSDTCFPNWESVKLIGVKRGHTGLERQAHADLMTESIGGEWFRASSKTLHWVKDYLSDNLNVINESAEQTVSKIEANGQQTEGLHLQSAFAPSSATAKSKENSKDIAQESRSTDLPGFSVFWEAYPQARRVSKAVALRAWLSKVKADSLWPEVLTGLEKWKKCDQWRDPHFIPHPATFLNQMRWKDEPIPSGTGGRNVTQRGPIDAVEAIRLTIENFRDIN
jgi:hypothetical protein